jgi:hypothetical protein
MKVADLIKQLAKLPQDMELIVSGDPEGNSYSPIGGVELEDGIYYVPGRRGGGDIWFEDPGLGMGTKPANAVPAIILWPGY